MKRTVLMHKDAYMPNWVPKVVRQILTRYKSYELSRHVIEHAAYDCDRSHGYTLEGLKKALDKAIGNPYEAFEVEATQYKLYGKWIVTKVCIRVPYDDLNDVCISIRPYRDHETRELDLTKATIVTAWLNNSLDGHQTLDKTKYITEEEWLRESS